MAFIDNDSANTLVLKPKGLKENNPKFDVFRRGDFQKPIRETNGVKGKFKGISQREFTFTKNGQEKKGINLSIHLEDGEEQYVLQGSWNGIFRGFVNSLCNAKIGDEITVRVYPGKNDFPGGVIYLGSEMLKWKLSWDEQKTLIEKITFKGETMNDYSRLEEKLFDMCEKFEMGSKKEELGLSLAEESELFALSDDNNSFPF